VPDDPGVDPLAHANAAAEQAYGPAPMTSRSVRADMASPRGSGATRRYLRSRTPWISGRSARAAPADGTPVRGEPHLGPTLRPRVAALR
jgi:hypothetical protein